MTRDVKESLIAVGAVALLFGLGYVALRVLPDDVAPPEWMAPVGLALGLINLAGFAIGLWRRRRRSDRDA